MKTLEDAVKIINGSPYFAMSVSAAERGVTKLLRVEVNIYQFSALVSYLISVGGPEFRDSQVLRLTNKRQFLSAAAQFSEHIYDKNGTEDKHLISRRNKERRLYTTMTLPVNNGKTPGVES